MYWYPQPGPQVLAVTCPADEILFGGSRGGGKAQPLDAQIMTPFGISTMGNMSVGKQVLNPDGTTARVLAVHKRGILPVYQISFADGAKCEASGDHLWLHKIACNAMKADRKYVHNCERVDYRVCKTTDLSKRSIIPLTSPVNFQVSSRNKTKLDPYLYGLLLGDGGTSGDYVGLTTADSEIAAVAEQYGFHWVGGYSWRASWASPIGVECEKIGLRGRHSYDKRIHRQFIFGSEKERWDTLAGLLDTDGHIDGRGHIQFVSTSEELADDVKFLVHSLGGRASKTSKIGKYRKNNDLVECRTAFMLYIRFDDASRAFRLGRKKNRVVLGNNGGWKPLRRQVSKVEYVGEKECWCITVDHPNGLYLTNDFVVTHNSDTTIGRHLYGAQTYRDHWNGLVIRRKYKDLNELRRRWDELISSGLPAERVGGENQTNYIRFANGAQVALMAFQRIEQLDDIQGHQYPEISIEECTNFPWFMKLVDKVSGANRSPHGVPTRLFCTGNPGGPGHLQVKDFFRLGSSGLPSGKVWQTEQKLNRVYIQSFLKDNQILCQNDPKYVNKLMGIQDPVLRKAWLDGNWDVYIGQAFNITSRHIVPAADPPPGVAIYMTFDWGFGAPFSVGWWWVDPSSDRITRFNEWYGWNGVPNEGLRLEDSKIAEGIKEREHKMGVSDRPIIRLAGPDCWNKKADYRGGGQGPSTAEIFRDNGLILRPGDPARTIKIRAFRERLVIPVDSNTLPQLAVGANCKQFLRTIPALAMGEDDPEYIDDDQEEHIFDESCHIVMARSKSTSYELSSLSGTPKIPDKRKALPTSHRKVWEELDKIREDLDNEYDEQYT